MPNYSHVIANRSFNGYYVRYSLFLQLKSICGAKTNGPNSFLEQSSTLTIGLYLRRNQIYVFAMLSRSTRSALRYNAFAISKYQSMRGGRTLRTHIANRQMPSDLLGVIYSNLISLRSLHSRHPPTETINVQVVCREKRLYRGVLQAIFPRFRYPRVRYSVFAIRGVSVLVMLLRKR